MSVKTAMTAIADAIRAKTGKTGELTLDQMATEIAGIQAGSSGDSSSGASKVYIGKVTADGSYVDVVHNLGSTDILLAVLWVETDNGVETRGTTMSMYFKNEYPMGTDVNARYGGIFGDNKIASNTSENKSIPVDENTFRFNPGTASTYNLFISDYGDYTVVIVAA